MKGVAKQALKPETLDTLEWWNDQDTLTTHKLLYVGEDIAPMVNQSLKIKSINKVLNKIHRGTFYNIFEDLPDRFKDHKFTVEQIGTAIANINIAYSKKGSYGNKVKPSLDTFFYNEHAKLLKGANRQYKLRFPFLHWMSNDATSVWDRQTKFDSEYKTTVDVMFAIFEKRHKLAGNKKKLTNADYNNIVSGIEKAIENVKAEKPSVLSKSFIKKIPKFIEETLDSKGIPVDLDHFGLGIHYLVPELKKRLYI